MCKPAAMGKHIQELFKYLMWSGLTELKRQGCFYFYSQWSRTFSLAGKRKSHYRIMVHLPGPTGDLAITSGFLTLLASIWTLWFHCSSLHFPHQTQEPKDEPITESRSADRHEDSAGIQSKGTILLECICILGLQISLTLGSLPHLRLQILFPLE